jgi:hypothetical protein
MSGTLDRKIEYGPGSVWWIFAERAAGWMIHQRLPESSVN